VNLNFDKPFSVMGMTHGAPGTRLPDFVVADWVIQKQAGYRQKFNILSCSRPMREENAAAC